jgi:hypothetical protein
VNSPRDLEAVFTVFVVSRLDNSAFGAVSDLGQDLEGLRSFAVVAPEDNDRRQTDVVTRLCEGRTSKEEQLFAWLTKKRPDTSAIRLAIVQSDRLASESKDSLNATQRWLKSLANTYAPSVPVKSIRVGAFAEGNFAEAKTLFVDGSAANLVVVPRDSQSHNGIAQPVKASDGVLLKSHIQIELATLFGLWQEMQSAIADELSKISGGINQVWLQFVSSRALILECPALPIASVVDGDGNLAVPVDCEAFPNPTERIRALVRSVYPEELRFESTEEPTGLVSTDARTFLRQYLSEFGLAIVRLPGLLLKDLQGELNSLSSTILQDAVGGASSHIRILFADDSSSEGAPPLDDATIAALIERLTAEEDSPRRLSLENRHWSDMVRKSLGLIDGSTAVTPERQQLGQENWLVVEKRAIGPIADSLGDVLSEFREFVDPDSQSKSPTHALVETADTNALIVTPPSQSKNVNSEPSALPDGAVDDVLASVGDGPISVLAESEDVLEPSMQESEATPLTLPSGQAPTGNEPGSVLPPPRGVHRAFEFSPPVSREPNSFLAGIASEFVGEARSARRRADEMIERLRRLPLEFLPRDVNAISNTIRVALSLGLLVGYFVTGTFTERRYWLSGEPLTSFSRDFIWTILATLIICVAVVGLLVNTTGRWQARAIIAVTFCSVAVAVIWVFFAPIREFVLRVRPVRNSAIVGGIVLVATVTISLISYFRNRLSKNRIRRRFSQVLIGLLIIYCLVGITAYLGNSRSPIRGLSDQLQLRLAIVGYISAASLLLAGAAVFAFVVLREKYRLNILADVLRWAEGELLASVSAERILRRAAIQWVGSAVVLTRLAQYPLGRKVHNRQEEKSMVFNIDSNLMKFTKAPLALTERGQHGLASTLRKLFIKRGWLTTQYLQLVKAFQKEWAFDRGLTEDDGSRVEPESCPVVPMWGEILDNEVPGKRWVFMQSVFAGKYDESLLVRSGDVKLEEAYRTILSDVSSHKIGDQSNIDAASFLGRLIPANGSKMLDGGLVGTVFAGNDPRQRMVTHVWWPVELLAFESSDVKASALGSVRPSEVLSSDRVSSTVRLFGACVSVSEMFSIDEISNGEISD